jgi:hypothetical protein
MITYLASCGSTTCDQFDSRSAKWFKIDQAGRDSNGEWIQQQISQSSSSITRALGLMPIYSGWERLLR